MKARSTGKITLKKRNGGLSTLELLIAFSVFILIITSVILVSFGSQSMIVDAELSESALYKAKEGLTLATLKDFDSLTPESSEDGIYTKEISVEPITNYAKEVKSKVSFNDGGRKRDITLSEIVTDPKNAEEADTCDLFLLSDWKNPTVVESISNSVLKNITQIDVRNKKIYVTTNSTVASDSDFHIIDISDLPHIHIASVNTGPGLNGVALAGNYAYVGNTSINAQLQIIDISVPDHPELYSQFKLPVFDPTFEDRISESIFYADKKVFIGTAKSDGKEFNIVDVSNPLAPVSSGAFETNTLVNDIYVVYNKAYLATATDRQMRILDVGNLGSIRETGSITLPQYLTQSGKSLYPLGDTIYLGRTWGGLSASNEFYILDARAEASIGSQKIGKTVNDVFVRSNLVFLATLDTNAEFQAWDVKDPSNMIKNSSLDLDGDGISLDCERNELYVATPSKIKIIEAETL